MALLGAAACAGLPAGTATAVRATPTLVPRFTAAVDFTSFTSDAPSGNNGTFFYDEASRHWRISKSEHIAFLGPDAILARDYYADGDRNLDLINGQCYNASHYFDPPVETLGFEGLFAWISIAQHIGQDAVGTRKCEVWHDATLNRTLCVDGDEPVYVDIKYSFSGILLPWRMIFMKITRDVDDAKLELPPDCVQPPVVCGTDEVKTMRLYLLHPKGQFNISNQDAADAQGDAVYICADRLWTVEDYKLVSAYEVSFLQKFGQYLNCNLYPPYCVGASQFHVGREAPCGMGNHASQCDDTEGWRARTGTWYSLPAGGRCVSPEQRIGVDCSWRMEQRVKTVELSCLFDDQHEFLKGCAAAKAPYKGITEAFLRVFASDDPALGGCPAVSPPGTESQWAQESLVVV